MKRSMVVLTIFPFGFFATQPLQIGIALDNVRQTSIKQLHEHRYHFCRRINSRRSRQQRHAIKLSSDLDGFPLGHA